MTIKKVNWPAFYYYPRKAKAVSILASLTIWNEILSDSRSGAASTMAPSLTTSGTEYRRSRVAQSDHCPASPNALHSTCTLTPLPPSGDTGVTKAVSSSGGRQPSYTISCRGSHTKGGRGGAEGGLKVDPEENQDKQRVGVEQNQKLRLPDDSGTYWFCPGTHQKRKFNWSLSLIQFLRSGRRPEGRSWGKPRQAERRLAVKAQKKTQQQVQFVIGCVWWKLKVDPEENQDKQRGDLP